MRRILKAIKNRLQFRKKFVEMSEAQTTPDSLFESGVSSSEREIRERLAAGEAEDLECDETSFDTLVLSPLAELSKSKACRRPKNDPIFTDDVSSDTDAEIDISEGKGKEVVYRRR